MDNAIVFPDNVLVIEDYAFDYIPDYILFIYGNNVQIIGQWVFNNLKNIKIARFPIL